VSVCGFVMDFRGGKAVGTYERDVLERADVSNYS
jgi:hypothetical protein